MGLENRFQIQSVPSIATSLEALCEKTISLVRGQMVVV